MNKKTKIVKQSAGSQIFLAGAKPEIEDLNNNLYNWAATEDNLRDFGDADNFSWFSCDKEKYIKARANTFITHRNKYFKNFKGKSLMRDAIKLAKKELESYPESTFVVYDPKDYSEPYTLGYLHSPLEESNLIDQLNGVKAKIHLNLDKLEVKEE